MPHTEDPSYKSFVKRYDRSYFDRWYRRSASPVERPADIARRARMIVSIAEHILGRSVRSVLDVGCGEGRWRAPLRSVRPAIQYHGVDQSEYVVSRFGRTRGIVQGSFADLGDVPLQGPFDIVLCIDFLHYLDDGEIRRGLETLPDLIGGICCIDVSTREDEPEGDLNGWHDRPASWYDRTMRRAGLVPLGLQCWRRV